MKLNQIHLYAINKVLRFFQIIGLTLWRANFIGPVFQYSTFSYFGLIFSVILVSVIVFSTILQHQKMLVGFDSTIYNTSMSFLSRNLNKTLQYSLILVIYVPVWIFRKKMRMVHEKYLRVKCLLNELDHDVSTKFICHQSAINFLMAFISASMVIIVKIYNVVKIIRGRSADRDNISNFTWDAILTYVVPPFFKAFCILHVIMLTLMTRTRFMQVRELLSRKVTQWDSINNINPIKLKLVRNELSYHEDDHQPTPSENHQ